MGMLINGQWTADADRRMQDGAFRREASALPDRLDAGIAERLRAKESGLILCTSLSCPWSHAVTLTRALKGLIPTLPMQIAGGPRIEGYGLLPDGPLTRDTGDRHLHQLYSRTDATYTGRATIPVLYDRRAGRILSNRSESLLKAFDSAGDGPLLYPEPLREEIDAMIGENHTQLTNAVYRAGLAREQTEYDAATNLVFGRLAWLDQHISTRRYLIGATLSLADLRLFACLVRFDTVYATHFRCTRRRLTEYPALWAYTRRLYNLPGVAETVDFRAIREGYYLNDGDGNPYRILADQPVLDWSAPK